MEVISISAKGKRENNEDYILSRQLSPDCSVFLVAFSSRKWYHQTMERKFMKETGPSGCRYV